MKGGRPGEPAGPSRSGYICVLSDATGATAERVVRATLVQFGGRDVEVELVADVKTVGAIATAVERTRMRGGLIAFTLVEERLRSEIVSLANEAGVATVDLIGPLLRALSEYLTEEPASVPGLFRQAGDEHYRRLDALSFTVRHDDGLAIHELPLADLVIVGPSRTSKTPLSVYLAHTRGLKVANVPLALGVEPGPELQAIDPARIVGLTMNAEVLARIRKTRLEEMGSPAIEYAGIDHVRRELQACHEVYRKRPRWPVVDVTGKAIEEIAAEILAVRAGK